MKIYSKFKFQAPISQIENLSLTEKSKKILNRFNFCEQGIQTYTQPKKVQCPAFYIRKSILVQDATTLTDEIARKKFVGHANQRIIYKEYTTDYEKQVNMIQKDKILEQITSRKNIKINENKRIVIYL